MKSKSLFPLLLAPIAMMFGAQPPTKQKRQLPRFDNPPPPPRKPRARPVDEPGISDDERNRRMGLHKFMIKGQEVWATNKKHALRKANA
jgi:hypothetical protein